MRKNCIICTEKILRKGDHNPTKIIKRGPNDFTCKTKCAKAFIRVGATFHGRYRIKIQKYKKEIKELKEKIESLTKYQNEKKENNIGKIIKRGV